VVTPSPRNRKKSTGQKLKFLPKSKHLSLAKDLSKIQSSILVNEIKSVLTNRFLDNKSLGEFVAELCKNDQPLDSIATSP